MTPTQPTPEHGCFHHHPAEATSHDPEVLRAALIRESAERKRAECSATMQTEVVKLALELLARESAEKALDVGLAHEQFERQLHGIALHARHAVGPPLVADGVFQRVTERFDLDWDGRDDVSHWVNYPTWVRRPHCGKRSTWISY